MENNSSSSFYNYHWLGTWSRVTIVTSHLNWSLHNTGDLGQCTLKLDADTARIKSYIDNMTTHELSVDVDK